LGDRPVLGAELGYAIEYIVASLQSGYSDNGWMVYGQHPAWMVVTLMGAATPAMPASPSPIACPPTSGMAITTKCSAWPRPYVRGADQFKSSRR
jgi:hypothetical protein